MTWVTPTKPCELGAADARVPAGTQHTNFREILYQIVPELTRHEPAAFVRLALSHLVSGQAGATWQLREAAVFCAAVSLEALLPRVLSPPGMPPPPGAAELSAMLGELLRAVLTFNFDEISSGATAVLVVRSHWR